LKNNPAVNTNEYDISVIIVNYKSWTHLENCLKSLEGIDQNSFSFEVIIVDNNSNDTKLDAFSRKFPTYKFVRNLGNYGFSSGNNFGMRLAKGEFLLFLNPDTIVEKNAILSLVQLAKQNLDYGIISCTTLNIEGKAEKEIRFFPKASTFSGISRAIYQRINKREISEKFTKTKDVVFPDWVSGSLIFISKKWFELVDGWSEDYWLYFEDVDLCKRITDAGGKIALTRNASIIHNHGGSSRLNLKTSALTKTEVIISKHVYINNHYNNNTRFFIHLIFLFFGLISKFLLAIIGVVLFFIPKCYLQFLIFVNLVKYYKNALLKKTWTSERAPNYLK
jgi:hypothetical protein